MKQIIISFSIIITILNSFNSKANQRQTINISDTIIKNKSMQKNENYTTGFLVDESPTEVFNAINNVRGWWSEQIEGNTDSLNAEFDYHYQDVHRCTMKIIEFVPGKKVVWLVEKNYFNFTKDKAEWVNTKISFDVSEQGDKTLLTFTHIGLNPDYECYSICSDSWGNYIRGSLKSLVETGKGKPNPYEPSIKNAETLKAGNKQ